MRSAVSGHVLSHMYPRRQGREWPVLFRRLAAAGFWRGVGVMKSLGGRKRRLRRGRAKRFAQRFAARGRGRALAQPRTAKVRRVFWGFGPSRLRSAPSALPALSRLSGRRINRAARFAGAYGPPPRPLARRGTLEVRLAETEAEVRAAQRLRYRVFYEEMSARPTARMAAERRDFDRFDAFADHLLVIDHSRLPPDFRGRGVPEEAVVGTYRLMRQEVADARGGFYTAGEYDIGPWIDGSAPGTRFLELGRSCVHPDHRSRPTLELMWHAIVGYLLHFDLDIMFGCASLEGTDPDALALPLSFLHHHCRHDLPGVPAVHARPELYVPMDRLAKDDVDPKLGLRSLPPLIKGYLRAGATIGDGAVVDRQFGTTDVLIIFPASQINDRYLGKFGKAGSRIGRAEPSSDTTPALAPAPTPGGRPPAPAVAPDLAPDLAPGLDPVPASARA